MKQFHLINSVIFIVRYFGGKKLGIPGLIEAYSNASKLLIDLKQLKNWFPTKSMGLEYPYNLENTLNNLFKKFDVVIKKQKFQDLVFTFIEYPLVLINGDGHNPVSETLGILAMPKSITSL